MKDFLKFTFASCLGVFLSLLLLSFIGMCMAGSALSSAISSDVTPTISPNSVLEIKFDQPIPEKTNNTQVSGGAEDLFNDKSVYGLHEIIDGIQAAKEDNNIKGIYLNLMSGPGGFAKSAALRAALEEFKAEGKFVYAYSKFMTQSGYYMASVADEIHIHPLGFIDFRGLASTRTFYKGMLDKIDAEVKVYYAGKFKSATEPYRFKKMSAENKYQVRTYLNELYKYFIDDIAASRNLEPSALRQYADEFSSMDITKALDVNMIDRLSYESEVIDQMKEKVGIDLDDNLKMASLANYVKSNGSSTDYSVKDKIAIVYAEGTIVDGEGENGSTGGDRYADIVRDIREDDKIKAVVLRVNSGGGSAIASDQIWYELEQVQKAGKPVVVSFGDVAASGGYYIACGADKIYAEKQSITGSIGVFRIFPIVQGTMEKHLGITHDTVLTGKMSGGLNPVFRPSTVEQRVMQAGTEQMYQTFLERVAEGRNMTTDEVHEVAQGRVWMASTALEKGLVDEIGNIDDALAFAADQANLSKYRTTEYPKVKTPFQEILDDLMNPSASILEYQSKKILGDQYKIYQELQEMLDADVYQARMLETVDFK